MNVLDKSFDFEERFVAFIDILGFSDYIIELEKTADEERLKTIKSVLNFMQSETEESNYWTDLPVYKEENGKMYEKELGDPRMIYISDCMIISTNGDSDGFRQISNKIHKIITELAVDGIFCRGAITKGKLFQHGKFLFGSAYMKAYNMESKAIYPRIIVDPEILSFFNLGDSDVPLGKAFYEKDADGYFYLRYFPFNYYPPYIPTWIDYLLIVRKSILRQLDKFDQLSMVDKKYEKISHKYEWLALEFNRNINLCRNYIDMLIDRDKSFYDRAKQSALEDYDEAILLKKMPPYDIEIKDIVKNSGRWE